MSSSQENIRDPEWVLRELDRITRTHHPDLSAKSAIDPRLYWPLGSAVRNGLARELDFWSKNDAAEAYIKFFSKISEALDEFKEIPLPARIQIISHWKNGGGDRELQRSVGGNDFSFTHLVRALEMANYIGRKFGNPKLSPTYERNSQNSKRFRGYASIHESRKLWAILSANTEGRRYKFPPKRPDQRAPFFAFLVELFEVFNIDGDVESACVGYSNMLKNIGTAAEDPHY